MVGAAGKNIVCMIDLEMLFVPHFDEAVITPEAVGMNHATEADLAPDHGLEHGFGAIGHDFREDKTIALEDAENDGFVERSSASFAALAFRAEIGFIDLDDTRIGR